MKKIDIVGIAFSNFRRRKTRSILTVSGVVIGVTSIVVMVSLGLALNVFFDKQTANMGDLTTITVRPGWDPNTGQQKGSLDDELVAQLEALDKVNAVSPEIELSGKLVSGKYINYANVLGVKSEFLDRLGYKPATGSFVGFDTSTKKDIKMLIGYEVPYGFYNPRDRNNGGMVMGGMMIGGMGGGGESEERPAPPVDLSSPDAKLKFTFDYSYGEPKQPGSGDQPARKSVLYKSTPLAILEQNMSTNYNIFIDIETAKLLKKDQLKQQQSGEGGSFMNNGSVKKTDRNKQVYDSIKVLTGSIDDTIKVTENIKTELGVEAYSNAEFVTQIKQIALVLQLILGGIGSISLLVAAIGITNTMIMSIYERTKEIGVMKVIGCQLKDIRTMFLCEAGFIGLFGGAIGLIFSYAISIVINVLVSAANKGGGGMGMFSLGEGVKLSIIPPWLALVAVLFAILVALVSGFLPARRAMKLSALEAMRN